MNKTCMHVVVLLLAVTLTAALYTHSAEGYRKYFHATEVHETDEALPLVASIFTSNMVLQRGRTTTIWGWSKDPLSVKVSVSNATTGAQQLFTARAGDLKRWMVTLPTMVASSAPLTVTVRDSSNQTVTLHNVVVGDVWLCSGQSNMQATVSQTYQASEEIPKAFYPNLRMFTAAQRSSREPLQDIAAQPVKNHDLGWQVATPDTVGGPDWQYFSGACFYFGRDLLWGLRGTVPIGVISSAIGGTMIEAWSPPEALQRCGISPVVPDTPYTTNTPTVLFNAMIHPLVWFSIRGAFWWQGESNADNATRYQCTFAHMIEAWQQRWTPTAFASPMTFIFVLLEPYEVDQYQFMRSAQLQALRLPNVGVSNAIDIGDPSSPWGSIHPRDRVNVGWRGHLQARGISYNDNSVAWRPPTIESARVIAKTQTSSGTDYTIQVRFSVDPKSPGPLKLKGTEQCQKCCNEMPFEAGQGPDHHKAYPNSVVWQDNRTVTFKIPFWQQPEFFFFDYTEYPQCAIYDVNGLPALPYKSQLNHV